MMSEDALRLVEKRAREQVLAFGLLTAHEADLYQESTEGMTLRLTKASRPMGYLYRLHVGGELAGTAWVRKESGRWAHPAGLLVAERYRGRRIRNSVPGDGSHPNGDSAGAMLLRFYTYDLISSGFQVTAECLNGNVRSWRLHDRIGYSLLDDSELRAYAAWRRKGIKREFAIEGGQAVQWDHVPNDAYDIARWSANRVYGKKPDSEPFAFMRERRSRVKRPLSMAWSLIRYGSLLRLARHMLSGRLGPAAGSGSKAVDPDLERGLADLEAGRIDHAIEALRAVIDRTPNPITTLVLLANAHMQRDEFTEAIRAAEKALASGPDYAPAHALLASAFAASNQLQQAVEHMQRAIELGADIPEEARSTIQLECQ